MCTSSYDTGVNKITKLALQREELKKQRSKISRGVNRWSMGDDDTYKLQLITIPGTPIGMNSVTEYEDILDISMEELGMLAEQLLKNLDKRINCITETLSTLGDPICKKKEEKQPTFFDQLKRWK